MAKTLHAEIESLRREVAELRAAQATARDDSEVEVGLGAAAGGADIGGQLRALAHEIAAFTDGAEKSVANHPLSSILGSLVLGVLIGRLTR